MLPLLPVLPVHSWAADGRAATGLPLVCHCRPPAQLVSTPHLQIITTAPSGGTLKVEGKLEAKFHIFCCLDQTVVWWILQFAGILLLNRISNKYMTIITIKEGNIKKHLNFHYHESTRCLMWVLFWTQWEHGLVAAGCWGGAVSCAAVRPLLSLSPRLASHPSSSRPASDGDPASAAASPCHGHRQRPGWAGVFTPEFWHCEEICPTIKI